MFPGQRIGLNKEIEIESELGSGAMGTVYRGTLHRDGKPPRPIALKVVAFGLLGNESAMKRFEREASILEQLRHPHIVRLYGTGKYKKTPFILMEFVDGEPLDRILGRRGRLGWEEVVTYAKQLCDALQHAHEKGIIHRDLKPSNLMVTADGVLKLTDFGIAKDTDVTALTGQNSTIGTAAYMSPEQCRGERDLSTKSDLYSLGVVLYELVTGSKPFTADTTIEMFTKHVHETPVRPSRLIPDMPVWLDNLIMHLMEKEKDKRPLDAKRVGEALADIEQKVAGQQSAGAELANARRGDRGTQYIDAEDRAAAQTLRTNKKKRKKKKADGPRIPTWAKAIPLLLGLAAVVGGGILMFTKDGDKDTPVTQTGGGDGTTDAPKPKAADPREPRGKQIETVLTNWLRRDKKVTPERADEERLQAAGQASDAEKAGDLPKARGLWEKVAKLGPGPDEYGDGWVWLAETRLAAVADADRFLKETRERVLRQQLDEAPWKFDADDPKMVAALAVRYGGGGGVPPPPTVGDRKPLAYLPFDQGSARKAWNDLFTLTERKLEHRAWYLLAAREKNRVSEPKPDEAIALRKKGTAEMLRLAAEEWQRVARLDVEVSAAERRDVRNRLRDVIELYKDEPDDAVKAAVERARKMLAEASKSPG